MKTTALALILGFFLVLGLHAANVSFLVIETGLPEETEKNQQSGLWESALLDVFFEAGHIVSNAPIMRLDAKLNGELPDAAEAEMELAVEGGAEFFIVALLNFKTNSGSSGEWPREISLMLYKTEPHKKIYEQKITGRNYRNTRELFDNLKKIAGGLVSRLNDR